MLKLSSDLLPALKGEAWVSEMSKQSFGFWACNFQLFQSSFLSFLPDFSFLSTSWGAFGVNDASTQSYHNPVTTA
jgi:hypothetical protein